MGSFESVALANKDYVAEQYRRFQSDPRSVDDRWAAFFAGFDLATDGNSGAHEPAVAESAEPAGGVFDLVHSYRELGHLVAHLNPLAPRPPLHPLLRPAEFGFTDADLARVVECGNFRGCTRSTLRELILCLQETYCRTIGVEYLHIQDQEQRLWLQERMEPTHNRPDLSNEERVRILHGLLSPRASSSSSRCAIRPPSGSRSRAAKR